METAGSPMETAIKRVCLQRGGSRQRLAAANLVDGLEIGPNLAIDNNEKK